MGSLSFRPSNFDSGSKLFVIPLISSWFKPFWSHSWRLQSDCGNCTLIVGFESDCGNCILKQCSWCLPHSGMWAPLGTTWKNLLIDCGDCSLIVEIALWLLRLHSDCGNCSLIVDIALWLIVVIAVGLRRLQLDCGHCSWIAEIAIGLRRLQLDCWDCKVSATYIYGWSSHRVSGRLRDICRIAVLFCNSNQSL